MGKERGNAESREELNRISGLVVDAAVKVHMKLGPGLFEQVYQQCLKMELEDRGLDVRSEVFKLAKKRLGLLLNFNVPILPQGIIRIVNQL